MIFAEQRHGVITSIVYELIGKGRELAKILREPLECILVGDSILDKAKDLITYGVDKVYVVQHPTLADLKEDPYTDIISQISEENRPNILLIGATPFGRSIAPRIATKLRTGLSADCIALEVDQDQNLVQIRPVYGGNILATILCDKSRPQMATVRYKAMKKANPIPLHKGGISIPQIDFEKIIDRTQVLEFKESGEISIVEADVIVSGGKGLGNAQGFTLLRELAKTLNGAVGSSRVAVDEGWIDYSYQVGLSGRTVRPKVYVAVGISGAIQHLAGMQTSDVIIAINKDPNAPIFKVATLGIVGDLYDIVPKLVKRIREVQEKS